MNTFIEQIKDDYLKLQNKISNLENQRNKLEESVVGTIELVQKVLGESQRYSRLIIGRDIIEGYEREIGINKNGIGEYNKYSNRIYSYGNNPIVINCIKSKIFQNLETKNVLINYTKEFGQNLISESDIKIKKEINKSLYLDLTYKNKFDIETLEFLADRIIFKDKNEINRLTILFYSKNHSKNPIWIFLILNQIQEEVTSKIEELNNLMKEAVKNNQRVYDEYKANVSHFVLLKEI